MFIPAMWFHNMTAKDFGIAVNLFWKNLDDKLYDPKDPYGNKVRKRSVRPRLIARLKPVDLQPFSRYDFISRI